MWHNKLGPGQRIEAFHPAGPTGTTKDKASSLVVTPIRPRRARTRGQRPWKSGSADCLRGTLITGDLVPGE